MDRSTVQTAAMLVGAVFLAVGILGFIPGITTNYDELAFAGEDSTAELLGIFQVSILHNIVHLVFGIAGLALARTIDGARDVPDRRRRDLPGAVAARPRRRPRTGFRSTRPTTGSTSRSAPRCSRSATSPVGSACGRRRPESREPEGRACPAPRVAERFHRGVDSGPESRYHVGVRRAAALAAALAFACALVAGDAAADRSAAASPSARTPRRSRSLRPAGIAGGSGSIALNTGSGEREGAWIVVTGARNVQYSVERGSLGPLAVELDFGHFVQFGRRLVPDALMPWNGLGAGDRAAESAALRPRDRPGRAPARARTGARSRSAPTGRPRACRSS